MTTTYEVPQIGEIIRLNDGHSSFNVFRVEQVVRTESNLIVYGKVWSEATKNYTIEGNITLPLSLVTETPLSSEEEQNRLYVERINKASGGNYTYQQLKSMGLPNHITSNGLISWE